MKSTKNGPNSGKARAASYAWSYSLPALPRAQRATWAWLKSVTRSWSQWWQA
jgi:hypothetical protein